MKNFIINFFFILFFLYSLYSFLILLGAIFFELNWIVALYLLQSNDYDSFYLLFSEALRAHQKVLHQDLLYPIRLIVFYHKDLIFQIISLSSHVWILHHDINIALNEIYMFLKNLIHLLQIFITENKCFIKKLTSPEFGFSFYVYYLLWQYIRNFFNAIKYFIFKIQPKNLNLSDEYVQF